MEECFVRIWSGADSSDACLCFCSARATGVHAGSKGRKLTICPFLPFAAQPSVVPSTAAA